MHTSNNICKYFLTPLDNRHKRGAVTVRQDYYGNHAHTMYTHILK